MGPGRLLQARVTAAEANEAGYQRRPLVTNLTSSLKNSLLVCRLWSGAGVKGR
jgi:hypothetical protein